MGNFSIVLGDPLKDFAQQQCFGVLVQYPNTLGEINDFSLLASLAQEKSALITIATDLLSLLLLKAPADFGADIVILAMRNALVCQWVMPPPHAAFFACKDSYKRSMPGRLIGVSRDIHGNTAYRMSLQTREQHIRRAKATSNICTAQVLLAVLSGFYAVYHGESGLRMIAQRVHRYSQVLAQGLKQLGYQINTRPYFDTIIIHTPYKAHRIAARAEERKINLRIIDKDTLGISMDESSSRSLIRQLWKIFALPTQSIPDLIEIDKICPTCIPANLLRKASVFPYLIHPRN